MPRVRAKPMVKMGGRVPIISEAKPMPVVSAESMMAGLMALTERDSFSSTVPSVSSAYRLEM